MVQTITVATMPAATRPGTYALMTRSFQRHLMAENKSPKTVDTYVMAVRMLGRFLTAQGMPTEPADISREHIEEFLIDLQSRSKPGTVSTRFRGLQQFFKWLVDEGEISRDPMVKMSRPIVPEESPAVLTETQIKKLLKVCDGPSFAQRRDTAIIRMLIDTGMRRDELARLTVDDIDWDLGVAVVLGKGRRPRACPFAAKAGRALDRYIRIRAKHPHAASDALWLGRTGPMTPSGIYQVVRDRAIEAGIGPVYPHQFRHSWAHMFRAAGGQEDDLMHLGGWRSRTMLTRYGKSAAEERAFQAHRRFSPGERF
jgi:site-specific recombinase XerD